ncbi:MAG: HAMP domain-containing sensor histidine kinase [Brachybacterium sp.]|nr:HAMP domain-containing sensor histidine kinase [Brachybacterium sp.]
MPRPSEALATERPGAVGRASMDQHPTPWTALVQQGALSICLVISLVLVDPEEVELPALFWTGSGLILLLTAMTFGAVVAERYGRFYPRYGAQLLLMVPVLDLVVLGLTRWASVASVGYHGVLMVLPAVWLAAALRWRGVGITLIFLAASLISGPVLVNSAFTTQVVSRSLVVSVVVLAVTAVVARAVSQRKDRSQRLDLVTASLGVVHGVLGPDGRLRDVVGRLGHGSRDAADVEELLEGPLLGEDGRTELAEDRGPLRRIAGGRELSGEVVWAGPASRRRALSVSARRRADGTMLVAVHDVTGSLLSVLQEEQFLANVSHELKTPLTSISGYIELLEDEVAEARESGTGVPPEQVGAHLAVVRRNIARLQSLILSLLETAKSVRPEGMAHRQRATDLAALVTAQIQSHAPAAAARGVEIEAEGLEEPVDLINADPERLAQAVDNLLSNAVKYSRQGGTVRIALEVEEVDPEFTATVRLSVRDDGIGIDEDDLQRLFTPYFRAATAIDSGVDGTGIGLMISRRIVRAHGGELVVESAVGEGTEAIVSLPRART